MCGICGIVALGRPPEDQTAGRMSELLRHRGPDGSGSFSAPGVALGFRRLAIIDLSEAGNQPFASEDGRLQLVHNGEIYNYRELRRELEAAGHRFRSATDTEVILTAYAHWGERCVERFNGMWAFAIWDAGEERLFCSRDRFGVKPFYYHHENGRFAFASEPKAFLADPNLRLRPNLAAVRDYLEQAYLDHTPETFFEGIARLPSAHSLVFDREGLRLHRYWALEPHTSPAGEAAEAVRELFLDSVRLRLRSDVPIGTCLSGGIDSSAVSVMVAHLLRTERESALAVGERQRTFTAYFEDRGFDERPYARAVVETAEAEPHWITFDAGTLVADLPRIVESQDEPFGSTSMCAQWYVMRTAREAGLTVMLDGQGGDEVFGGYRGHVGERLADLLAGSRLGALSAELAAFRPALGTRPLVSALARPFAPERIQRLIRSWARGSATLVPRELAAAAAAKENGSPFPDRLRRYQQLLLQRRGLPELLRYEDRNSMAHSLEARVPFLDYRLVELAFSLPGEELIRGGRTKSVLRRALHDLLPPTVAARTDKLGFVTPEARWLRGPLGDLAADIFASRSFGERGFVDAAAARRRLERHRRSKVEAGFELWRALNLELWARRFLDR